MKKLIILTLFSFSVLLMSAQNSFLMGIDTLKGVDTLEFRTGAMNKNTWLSAIQADFEYISDLSALDSIKAQTSINNINYANLTPLNYNVFGFPGVNASINNKTCVLIDVVGIPNPYFGFVVYGVAGDTTVIRAYGLERK